MRELVERDEKDILAAMASIREDMTNKVSGMELPEIAESFQKQHDTVTEWRVYVLKYRKILDPKYTENEVTRQWLKLNQLLDAVVGADEHMGQHYGTDHF